MYLLIEYPVGVIVEAIALAIDRDRMRVAAADFPDALELTRSGDRWFTETGDIVQFEFLLSRLPVAESVSSSRPALVARAAGSLPI
ncbi:MAG TPA: hypothetical protein VLY04_15785 [Bryobacteraceae bacterium]|nr:hypothetical protein [Bryobacteraceae bacterium]